MRWGQWQHGTWLRTRHLKRINYIKLVVVKWLLPPTHAHDQHNISYSIIIFLTLAAMQGADDGICGSCEEDSRATSVSTATICCAAGSNVDDVDDPDGKDGKDDAANGAAVSSADFVLAGGMTDGSGTPGSSAVVKT